AKPTKCQIDPELEKRRLGFEKVLGLFGVFALYVWCYYDARNRGYDLQRWLSLVIILFGLIGLPVYLFKTRRNEGWRSALRTIWHLVGFACLWSIVGAISWAISRKI